MLRAEEDLIRDKCERCQRALKVMVVMSIKLSHAAVCVFAVVAALVPGFISPHSPPPHSSISSLSYSSGISGHLIHYYYNTTTLCHSDVVKANDGEPKLFSTFSENKQSS